MSVVDAELVLLDMRSESRRVDEASSKLCGIMQAATCDNMTHLEGAIHNAKDARLNANQVSFVYLL